VTVVSDTTAHTGVASSKNLETVTFAPSATSVMAKHAALTINASTTGTYETYNNTTASSSSAVITASGADFTGDVGMPVTVSYDDVSEGGYYSPFSPPQSPPSPAVVASYISAVGGGGDTATISQYEKPTTGVYTDPTETINSQFSGAVVVTVGSPTQATGTVGTDYDLALTNCESSLHADAGVIYPNNVTVTNTGPVSNPSSALALEAGVQPINDADINFPGALPSGYSWGDGGEDTAQVSFDSSKDALNLSTDAETFVDGTVPATDPYTTSKASMSFGVGTMVVCTDAQLQAIGTGNGVGSGIDHSAIPAATSTGLATTAGSVGAQALKYCDGGTSSAISPSAAFDELAVVEADPNAQAAGSDGTGVAAIWQVGGSGTAIL